MDYLLPAEIITNILSYMSMTDLVRIERTCRLLQSFSLCEIEKRIIKSSDEWGILVSCYTLHKRSSQNTKSMCIDTFRTSQRKANWVWCQIKESLLLGAYGSCESEDHVWSSSLNSLLSSPKKNIQVSIVQSKWFHHYCREGDGGRKDTGIRHQQWSLSSPCRTYQVTLICVSCHYRIRITVVWWSSIEKGNFTATANQDDGPSSFNLYPSDHWIKLTAFYSRCIECILLKKVTGLLFFYAYDTHIYITFKRIQIINK